MCFWCIGESNIHIYVHACIYDCYRIYGCRHYNSFLCCIVLIWWLWCSFDLFSSLPSQFELYGAWNACKIISGNAIISVSIVEIFKLNIPGRVTYISNSLSISLTNCLCVWRLVSQPWCVFTYTQCNNINVYRDRLSPQRNKHNIFYTILRYKLLK